MLFDEQNVSIMHKEFLVLGKDPLKFFLDICQKSFQWNSGLVAAIIFSLKTLIPIKLAFN